jgi:hypothetical protein
MSINQLSTELDENIIRRLGVAELNVLSKSSKYYRPLTEPFLYKDFTFPVESHYRIMNLFLTILGRQGLAKLIWTFTLTNEPSKRPITTVNDAYHTAFWDSIPAAKDVIGTFVKGQSLELALRWFGRIYTGLTSLAHWLLLYVWLRILST